MIYNRRTKHFTFTRMGILEMLRYRIEYAPGPVKLIRMEPADWQEYKMLLPIQIRENYLRYGRKTRKTYSWNAGLGVKSIPCLLFRGIPVVNEADYAKVPKVR